MRKLIQLGTSSTVVRILKQLLSEHGIPDVISYNNGPHYKFRKFFNLWIIKLVTSSLHYAILNPEVYTDNKEYYKKIWKRRNRFRNGSITS